MQNPLDKVVFIQKIAAFSSRSFSQIIRLNYVNSSWADTIQNYSFHLFDKLACDQSKNSCDKVLLLALIKYDTMMCWLLNSLLSSITFLDRIDCLVVACEKSRKTETVKFMLHKIKEVGGLDLLRAQLTAVDAERWNCIMHTLFNFSATTSSCQEVITLLCDNIVEVGGGELLKELLSATDRDGWSCMMHVTRNAPTPEVIKLIFEKIVEAGGLVLLTSQVTSPDREGVTCFLNLCRNCSDDDQSIKVFCDKIMDYGGHKLLRTILTHADLWERNALMHACSNPSISVEILKVLFEKIVEVSGREFLEEKLTAVDKFRRSCFLIFLDNQEDNCKQTSHHIGEIVILIASLLHQLHLFKEQYAKTESHQQKILKEKANIENDSWVPDAESIAEVKRILMKMNV